MGEDSRDVNLGCFLGEKFCGVAENVRVEEVGGEKWSKSVWQINRQVFLGII